MYNYNLFLGGNKYNARTETQYKFSQRVEKETGWICNFDYYFITRGRGWSKADGSCGASVGVRSEKNGNAVDTIMGLYYPLRAYLSKKKYIALFQDVGGPSLELAAEPPEERWS